MKIYNEVISQFNDLTGQWETIFEDAEEYNGPMLLAMALPSNATSMNASDKIADTIKTTAGYFTNGDGTLGGSDIHTGSLTDSNEKYYFNTTQMPPQSASAEVQFSVTFGHAAGSGSNTYGDSTTNANTLNGETEVIYRQFAGILIAEPETSGGFKISQQGSSGQIAVGDRDDYFYALIAKREKFKDRINKKSWTLVLSGSDSTGSGVSLSLTDDSSTVAQVATPAGPRHNIVSGTLGTAYIASSVKTYGWFYPERGVMIFSGAELSSSIPGGPNFGRPMLGAGTAAISASYNSTYYSGSAEGANFLSSSLGIHDIVRLTTSASGVGDGPEVILEVVGNPPTDYAFTGSVAWPLSAGGGASGSQTHGVSGSIGEPTTDVTASFSIDGELLNSSSGFAPNINSTGNPKNAIRFINCMRNVDGNTLQLRSEEDATQENYFCRVKSTEYNFSANPTFVSGSKNKLRNLDMHGNPQTFITGLGLYNSAGQLLAVSSLSKPLKKNFASEATIKVKLTY